MAKLMKKIVVLSGKGGVGKSSITASLGVLLSETHTITAVDCDVDAANLALVLGVREPDEQRWDPIQTSAVAKVDMNICTGCKQCFEQCYFNAIEWNDGKSKPVIIDFGCEGCGLCVLVCPVQAIRLIQVENARIGSVQTAYGFSVVSGQLNMGASGSGKIVAAVKQLAMEIGASSDIMLCDAAAGIGCPVIASVVGNDYAILVTEPTPSALADLERAYAIVSHFHIPAGIIINKWDINPDFVATIEQFARHNALPVLTQIPYTKTFVQALVDLKPVIISDPNTRQYFEQIMSPLVKE
jgi:MinD superfamily P-loop ATPase